MRCWPVCGRASWNWNFPLKNEPHPKYPISPAIPHFHQIAFGTPSMTTHIGKIGRLPTRIRDLLGMKIDALYAELGIMVIFTPNP